MVKLSDALRGAADRAPLGDVTVSTETAARRVSRNRATRGAATGIVGVTALGVLVLGIVGPQGTNQSAALSDAATSGPLSENTEASGQPPGAIAGSQLVTAICGKAPGPSISAAGIPLGLATMVPDEVAPGAPLPVRTVASVPPDASADGLQQYATTTPEAFVTWNGIVVAIAPHVPVMTHGAADQPMMNPDANITQFGVTPGDSHEFVTEVPLENCWDGEPLPAGQYQSVVSQEFYEVLDGPKLKLGPGFTLYGDSIPAALTITGEPTADPFAQYLDLKEEPQEPMAELPTQPPLADLSDLPPPTVPPEPLPTVLPVPYDTP